MKRYLQRLHRLEHLLLRNPGDLGVKILPGPVLYSWSWIPEWVLSRFLCNGTLCLSVALGVGWHGDRPQQEHGRASRSQEVLLEKEAPAKLILGLMALRALLDSTLVLRLL